MVVPAGNAPASSGYQPGALLLSYRTFAGRNVIARERDPNIVRLEHVHRLAHARGTTRNGGNEPVALVVAAQEAVELRFVTGLADEQQQVALLRLALHDGDIQQLAQVRRHAEFEELPVAIAPDVHGEIHRVDPLAITLSPARSNLTHLQPRAHRGEPG